MARELAQHRGTGPRFNTGAEGTSLSQVKTGRNTPMTHEEIRLGPLSPKPKTSYKVSIRNGKISISAVRKNTGRNIVSNEEIKTFASNILPEGGREKSITPPRLGGYLPEENVTEQRRTGYKAIDPPVDRQQALRPTPERRTGIRSSQDMDTRGGSGLQPNNNRVQGGPFIPSRTERPPPMPLRPDPIEMDEDTAKPMQLNRFNMKEVNPDTGGFEEGFEPGAGLVKGRDFYGGGKVHARKKKRMRGGKMKKYAKGGGIRKPKYS